MTTRRRRRRKKRRDPTYVADSDDLSENRPISPSRLASSLQSVSRRSRIASPTSPSSSLIPPPPPPPPLRHKGGGGGHRSLKSPSSSFALFESSSSPPPRLPSSLRSSRTRTRPPPRRSKKQRGPTAAAPERVILTSAPTCVLVVVSRFHPLAHRNQRGSRSLRAAGALLLESEEPEEGGTSTATIGFRDPLCSFSGDLRPSLPLVVPVSEETKSLTVGRSEECDIVISLRYVSRKHCIFRNRGGQLSICPLAATNPTKLNSVPVGLGEEATLHDRDRVTITGYEFHVCRSPKTLGETITKFSRSSIASTASSLPPLPSSVIIASSSQSQQQNRSVIIPKKTGLYFDPKMDGHHKDEHLESPQRTAQIIAHLHNAGLISKCRVFKNRLATEAELRLCHDREYIRSVFLSEVVPTDDCYVVQQQTCLAARLSCGGVIELVERVCKTREIENGLAIVRPPGHHAGIGTAEGFCFFNNAAVAARIARQFVSKVAVIDWDVHHGNGTQEILENDPSVFYFSSHLFGDFYPGTGQAEETGLDKGAGTNMNVPFPESFGDSDLVVSFLHVLMPALLQFQPDLIIVSAGFDAGIGDPLGSCKVHPRTFGLLLSLLLSVTKRIVLALEGGYNPIASARCAVECVRVLLGDSIPRMPRPIKPPRGSTVGILRRVRRAHESTSVLLRTRVSSTRRVSVGVVPVEVDEEESVVRKRKRKRKRKRREEDEMIGVKPKAKRRKVASSDDDDEEYQYVPDSQEEEEEEQGRIQIPERPPTPEEEEEEKKKTKKVYRRNSIFPIL